MSSGQLGDHPRRVEVATNALEGDVGKDREKVVAEEVNRKGEVLGGFGESEGKESVCMVALKKEEGSTIVLGVARVE